MKLGLLGPQGTFSEVAARKWRPEAELVFYDDMELAMQAVDKSECDQSIVPVENSIEGQIPVVHDRLLEMEATVIGEVVLPIRQCLMSKGKPSEIKVIVSIPAAIGQCRHYLREHYPGAEIQSTGSTAHAAKLAQEFPEMAAIGCAASAEKYHLQVIEEGIQDRSINFTRFLVLGRKMPAPTGRDKTSLAVYLDKDRPGALYDLLGEFASRKINMTRIESRPSKLTLGDYWFFIDIEGHSRKTPVSAAILSLRNRTVKLKVLGSYPVADVA